MQYRFEFRPYGRRFNPPLQTSYGTWNIREGIILRLTDETGRASCGEIAPISWFGSETIEQAWDFCRQLPPEITDETIFSIPFNLPACQFGFESAWEGVKEQRGRGAEELEDKGDKGDKEQFLANSPLSPPSPLSPLSLPSPPDSLTYSGLLPAGEGALQTSQTLWSQGYRTFKWKIGVYAILDELKIFDLLTQTLPASTKLRLDANGGLSYDEANLWLWTCDNIRATDELPLEVEFIEQPLPVDQFEGMQELSFCYATAIALDESVATLDQLKACYKQGWRGIFVIKPSIAGSPKRLRQFCRQHDIDAVFSSVFEATVGRRSALKLAAELSHRDAYGKGQALRAVGFGINHWFNEDETWLERLWKNR